MPRDNWTREQEIVVFNLYCKIPFAKATSANPDIVKTAKIIGRSPNSVKMKIGNFGSFDPELKKRGIVGLANASRLDEEIWNEFNNNWDELAYQSELLIAKFQNKSIEEVLPEIDLENLPAGKDKMSMVKVRVNQNFFRQTILSSYCNTCCITGINVPQLLVASHILPWAKFEKERLNPHNGLCLNALHDKAYDNKLISITPDFVIKVSDKIKRSESNEYTKCMFENIHDKKINIPERFVPERKFLDAHYSAFLKNN